ncbi:Potassium channel SKOR [Citrus sinensis]|nr:Potassium channel SKOR [Citrus sinensis]
MRPGPAVARACGRKEEVRIIKLSAVEIYYTHTAACIFYYLATTLPPEKEGYTWIGSLKLGDYSYSNFRDIDIWTRYTTSMYFAIITMATVGYGDIHAVNLREMIFIMIYVSFDMVLGAYLIGNMTALIVKGSKTEKFRDKMTDLIKYMNRNRLGRDIRDQIKGHMRLQYESNYTEASVLQDIPVSIRAKISQTLYMPYIEKVSLFKGCSSEFINQIGKESNLRLKQLESDITFHIGKHEAELALRVNSAAYHGDLYQLKGLIRAGADLNKTNYDGRSPLVLVYFSDSRKWGDSDFLKRVLSNGVDPNSRDYDHRTPLHVAASEGLYLMVKLLLEAGASVFTKDRWGNTPLDEGRMCGNKNLIKLLEDAKCTQLSKFHYCSQGMIVTVSSGLPDTDKRQAGYGAVSTRTKAAYRIWLNGKPVTTKNVHNG